MVCFSTEFGTVTHFMKRRQSRGAKSPEQPVGLTRLDTTILALSESLKTAPPQTSINITTCTFFSLCANVYANEISNLEKSLALS